MFIIKKAGIENYLNNYFWPVNQSDFENILKYMYSSYNSIALTIDMIDDNPNKVRLFALRSFGESLYHSITDASLEYGFKSV